MYSVIALVAALTSVGIYTLIQSFHTPKLAENVLDNPVYASSAGTNGVSKLKEFSESFREVAKKVGPAVVNIKATKGPKKNPMQAQKNKRSGGRRPMPQMPDDEDNPYGRDPFFDFFERFGMPFNMPQETPQTSLGSGFIIDKKGIVVTNNHVVEGANEILVTLADQKTDIKAKVLGTDPRTDLAVLKLESGRDFPSVDWANSDTVEVGDWAIAVGSPFALGQSVTMGIVSAKGRSSAILTGSDSGDLIQTDAAINPGNSGGPLCTLDKKVMGVNTAIYTRSGGYMGIGFAIPSNLAKDIVEKLIKGGKIIRGWLGVLIQPLNSEDPEGGGEKLSKLAKSLGIKDGVLIHQVIEEGPAAAAGLDAGDVILEVDGVEIKDTKDVKGVTLLQRMISNFKPGQVVKLKVVSLEKQKPRVVSVKIGELPQNEAKLVPRGGRSDEGEVSDFDKLGLAVGKNKDGVKVEAVQPGSIAHQFGIKEGDIIVKIDGKDVKDVKQYQAMVKSLKREANIRIKRGSTSMYLRFPIEE